MNNLPNLILREIFSFFSLKEKSRLKAVCCQWKNELDSHQPTSLCLYHLLAYPPNIQWAFTNELVGYPNSFQITNSSQINIVIQRFRSVRKCFLFQISTLNGVEELLNRINEFERLEQLEIYGVHLPASRIESAKLHTLSLKYSTFPSLQLDTPDLEALICHEEITRIRFSYPERLRTLLVNLFDPHIKQLVNLEHLSCIIFDAVDSRFLKNFPKLKRIQLNNRNWNLINDSVIRELRKQKSVLGLVDLDIIEFCFESPFYRINDPDYAITSTNVREIRNSYSQIPLNLQFLFEVDYVALCQTFKPLPSDFFAKFTDIEVVRIEGQVDQADMMQFLKKCVHLYSVWIKSTGLNQAFFDQLHEIQALEELTIDEPEWRIEDYRFLDRLTHLKTVLVYSPLLSVRFFRLFFERTKYARELYFRNTSYESVRYAVSLFIYKELKNGSFEAKLNDEEFREFNSLDEVLNFLREEAPLSEHLLDLQL